MMASKPTCCGMRTELADIPGTALEVVACRARTWAIGGWMWGGTDEAESISTIRTALERGINVIDTAPVYGFGRSEEIVGKAIAEGRLRSRVVIATKTGLEWQHGSVFRNASRARILREVEDFVAPAANRSHRHLPGSLARSAGDDRGNRRGDAHAVHSGKDPRDRREQFLGRPNGRFRRVAPLHVLQSPTTCSNAASRPICCPMPQEQDRDIGYGRYVVAFCRDGCSRTPHSSGDDLRRSDPKFRPRFAEYLTAVRAARSPCPGSFDKRVIHLAIRWVLDQGITARIVGRAASCDSSSPSTDHRLADECLREGGD